MPNGKMVFEKVYNMIKPKIKDFQEDRMRLPLTDLQVGGVK